MKKTFLILAVIVLAGFTSNVMAQSVGTAAPTAAGAKIVTALTLTQISPLHFGTMTIPSTAATVQVDPLGVRSLVSGTIILLAQTPVATNAAYSVAGSAASTYAITLPSSITISNGIPANDMTVNGFTSTKTLNVGTLDGAGHDTFGVGATLNLANAQPAGVYAGTFNVTIAYN